MKYVGGKHKIGKKISELLKLVCLPEDTIYLEPFCGSLGVFKYMTDYKKCYASDIHPDLILLWKKVRNKKLNMPLKNSKIFCNKLSVTKSPNALKALVGFGCSFGGEFFSGYSQKYAGSSGRNFYNEVKNSIRRIAPYIQQKHINFYCKSYNKWKPKNMLIYCDPPYKNTTGYKINKKEFNHDIFWNIIREWSKNNFVFVSEKST